MATLLGMLASLTREDGSLDLLSRRQQLDSLMENLLPSERRRIKQQLSAMTCSIDFVPKLPIEVVINISNFMNLSDLSAARLASKSWLGCFDRPDLVNYFMKKHFRMIYESSSFKSATASARRTSFNFLSGRDNRVNRGEYHSMASFSNARLEILSSTGHLRKPSSTVFFSENRLVWTSDEMIYVKDLVSDTTKSFVTPDRKRISWTFMHGDFLLAYCAPTRTNLYAWSIETGEIYNVRLPSLLLMADIKNGNAFITLRDGNVLQWTIGRCLRQLKLSIPPKSLIFLCCDPLAEETFIRCFWDIIDPSNPQGNDSIQKVLRLTAEKLTEERVVGSSTIDIPMSEGGRFQARNPFRAGRRTNSEPPETIDPLVMSDTPGLDENYEFNAILSSKWMEAYYYEDGYSDPSLVFSFLRVTYDAVEGHWHKSIYTMPRRFETGNLIGKVDLSSIHFAGNQALVPVRHCNEFLVVAIKPFGGDWVLRSPPSMKLRYIYGSHGENTAERELIITTDQFAQPSGTSNVHKFGLQYAWAKQSMPIPIDLLVVHRKSLEENEGLKIRGNSTFTVLFGLNGYIVWCYDKDIILPQQLDLDREVLRYWPNGALPS